MTKSEKNKITRFQPSQLAMPANQHHAATYGEWCEAEAKRLGGDNHVYRTNKSIGFKQVEYCRIQRDS